MGQDFVEDVCESCKADGRPSECPKDLLHVEEAWNTIPHARHRSHPQGHRHSLDICRDHLGCLERYETN